MNNIQKAFKTKSKLRCMADGGSVGRIMNTPAMALVPPAQSDMRPPTVSLRHGGKVHGKGGPTDDKVGPVALSNEEYVLPADTVKAVGKENLDALRYATHDFDDDSGSSGDDDSDGDEAPAPKKKSGLRKMADGGIIQPELPAYRTPNGFQATPTPSNPTFRPPVPVEPPPTVGGALATTGSRVGNFMKGSVKLGGLPIGAAVGAAESFGDLNNGYRDAFNNSIGATGPVSSVMGDAARTMGNVGNSLTMGIAGKFGRGLSSAINGDGFGAGWSAPSDKEAFMQAKNGVPPAAVSASTMANAPTAMNPQSGLRPADAAPPGVNPASYQSQRLAEMGVPVSQQGGTAMSLAERNKLMGPNEAGKFVNLGSYGGDAPIYGSASKPGGKIDTFVGVGGTSKPDTGQVNNSLSNDVQASLRDALNGGGNAAQSRGPQFFDPRNPVDAINERYDALVKTLNSKYTSKDAQGNLAKHLMEVEQMRAQALGQDAQNKTQQRGQDINSQTAANALSGNMRMQALNTLGNMADRQGQMSLKTQEDQMRLLLDAQKNAREGEEKGFDRYTGAIGNMFMGADGKPDKVEQEKFTSFIQASDPQAAQKFSSYGPQEQMKLLQNFKTLYDMNKARNQAATGGMLRINQGANTNRMDMPVDVREATFNDMWNNHLSPMDYAYSKLNVGGFGTNPNVVITESGQPVLLSDYATTNGQWDADKENIISQRTGRKNLRGN